MKSYLTLATVMILFSSCLKQSIADAMLGGNGGKTTATCSYEVNGTPLSRTVEDADNTSTNVYWLRCVKSNGYVFGVVTDGGDLSFTFYTDSLRTENYMYTSSMLGPTYITTFGRPQYLYGPSDFMKFTVTSHTNGHISGTFSGRLTPMIMAGSINNTYGTPGSTVITNGTFTNVPVAY